MSDPYEEATRHERTGMSTLAKVFLVGGGLLATLVIAVGIWMAIALRSSVDELGEYTQQMRHEYVVELEAAQKEVAEAAAELAEARAEAVREVAEARRAGEMMSEAREVAARLAELQEAIVVEQAAAEEAARNAEVVGRTTPVSNAQPSIAEAPDPVAAKLSRAVVTVFKGRECSRTKDTMWNPRSPDSAFRSVDVRVR